MKSATRWRACSYIAVASSAKVWTPAVDICIIAAIKLVHRLEDGKGFLSCRRGIQIDEGNTRSYFATQDGEILSNGIWRSRDIFSQRELIFENFFATEFFLCTRRADML